MIQKLKQLYQTKKEIINYLIFGLLTTIVNYIVFFLYYYYLNKYLPLSLIPLLGLLVFYLPTLPIGAGFFKVKLKA